MHTNNRAIAGRLVAVAVCTALSISGVHAADPVVSNVRASQRAGTELVDIYYNVTDSDGDQQTVSVQVKVAGTPISASSFSSGTPEGYGSNVTPGNNRHIVWNAGVDWDGQFSDQVTFVVTADDGTAPSGDYLVIDLAGGSSASSYPVSTLSSVPAGGWTDEYKTTKLVLRRIPAGTFTMGSPSGELGRRGDETRHQVTLTQDFYIGVFEVTQKQWERVMGTWPSYHNNVSYRDSRPVEEVSYNSIRGSSAGAGWPSNRNVDADSFMGRLRARTGRGFDLPTESQWEYAGRAGTTTALNSGYNLTNKWSDTRMAEVGRYWHGGAGYRSQSEDTSVGTAKVGSYLGNQWGLHDIHGNVWEWCLDWYGTYPGTVTDPVGPTSGVARVYRGGSGRYGALHCRVAIRGHSAPDHALIDHGFRTVLPPGQQ